MIDNNVILKYNLSKDNVKYFNIILYYKYIKMVILKYNYFFLRHHSLIIISK